MLRRRKEARLRKQNGDQTTQKSPWSVAWEQLKESKPFRCTGEAIQCAIDLATIDTDRPSTRARILLFTNGCPNYGDGRVTVADVDPSDSSLSRKPKADVVDAAKLSQAVEYYTILAKAACEVGIAMDVMCTGSQELGLPAYQALVEPSSGYVLTHEAFTDENLVRNVGFLLRQTALASSLHFSVITSETGNKIRSRGDNWSDGCILDLRLPRYVETTHSDIAWKTTCSHSFQLLYSDTHGRPWRFAR
jgi:hypothetical protein